MRVPERWIARALLAVVLFLNIIIVWILKLANDWNARFFNALEQKNVDAFWGELRYFVVIASLFILVAVYRLWFRQMLQIRWRRWLTEIYYREWLRDRTYYRMELGGTAPTIRSSASRRTATRSPRRPLAIVLGLISEVLTLITFTAILWQLSGSITAAHLRRHRDSRLHDVGRRHLRGHRLLADLQDRPAAGAGELRAAALQRRLPLPDDAGARERREHRPLRRRAGRGAAAGRRLRPIYAIWWDYMRYNKRLTWFTAFYGQAADVFPLVVASPRYFSGAIPFGVLTQTANAFGRVQGALSWFVDAFASLADWKATTDRLTTFSEAMAAAKRAQRTERRFDIAAGDEGALALDDVEVALPGRQGAAARRRLSASSAAARWSSRAPPAAARRRCSASSPASGRSAAAASGCPATPACCSCRSARTCRSAR